MVKTKHLLTNNQVSVAPPDLLRVAAEVIPGYPIPLQPQRLLSPSQRLLLPFEDSQQTTEELLSVRGSKIRKETVLPLRIPTTPQHFPHL